MYATQCIYLTHCDKIDEGWGTQGKGGRKQRTGGEVPKGWWELAEMIINLHNIIIARRKEQTDKSC